ncbi:hypothetical protein RRG08_007945 [Elysia crispata]|uniref:Secreted protein n=1 Tax=Elysia crispata TaxID=231223 RepID=A0AAE0ZRV0_9GAST|nr:hypothetical protein RRG08_007945 [Elysia crispata]
MCLLVFLPELITLIDSKRNQVKRSEKAAQQCPLWATNPEGNCRSQEKTSYGGSVPLHCLARHRSQDEPRYAYNHAIPKTHAHEQVVVDTSFFGGLGTIL